MVNWVRDYKLRENTCSLTKMTKILVWIVCKIPDNPYIMLNMDASVSSPRGLAYGGGIFRDDKGVWIKGFSFYFGKNPYVGS